MPSFRYSSAFLGLALLVVIHKTAADAGTTPSSSGPDALCLTPPSGDLCSLVLTRWFYNATSSTCQTFAYGCAVSSNVFADQASCVARCGPSAIHCGTLTCADPCQMQLADNGICSTCVCSGATCQGVVCGANETCRMVAGQCQTPVESCFNRPSCRPLIEPTTAAPFPCPLLDCLTFCQYGTNQDSNGCDSCMCYDPCVGYECPEGETCMMTANGCSGSATCYDPSLRNCGAIPVTQPMIAGPSSEALLQCCQNEGVVTACQGMCVANFSVTSVTATLLTICSDDVGKYLNCASNNKSVASCCERKAVSASCLNMCLGNLNVTPQTNLQDYTQCLMSGGFNDVISCYQQAWTAPLTSSTTPTPTTTTTKITMATPTVTTRLPCPIPMCAQNCVIAIGANGCQTCVCTTGSSSSTSTSTTTTTTPTPTPTQSTTTSSISTTPTTTKKKKVPTATLR